MENRLRETLFQAVNAINDRLVLDGMDAALDRFIPLLEVTALAGEYIVYFFGQVVFDTDKNILLAGTYDSQTIEKILIQNISDVRAVLNHVTASIQPSGC